MFALLWLLGTPAVRAHGTPNVLLVYDSAGSGAETQTLYDAITAAGPHVDLSAVDESAWDATNPALTAYDVVIHLNGTTSSADMPAAGQAALDPFVAGGGGFLHFEWNSYERSTGGLAGLGELTLFDYGARRSGTVTLIPTAAHPVVANVPASFTFSAGYNAGTLRSFSTAPASVVATDGAGNPAVAVREYGSGRVVGFHHAGNHGLSANATFADLNVQQLVIDGVFWVARCDEDGDLDRTPYCGGLDCDDADPATSSLASELCDGYDNDCDGSTDESDAIDLRYWYLDGDSDGYGWPYLVVAGCAAPSGYVADATDCDDTDAAVHPGAEERCDGADEDCDQVVDNDPVNAPIWYTDADGDGQGAPNTGAPACEAPFGAAPTDTDCDDADPNVYLGAPEQPYDGRDQDCDGQDLCDVDEDSFDADLCGGPDCDDADAAVSPAAIERWYDGADQDCDGRSDYDADADGFDSASYNGQDCDDADSTRYPGAPDDPDDGVLSDCALASEDDRDGDGYERPSAGGDDCDDANSSIHPAAAELWYDGVDQDCDGWSDLDADRDGHDIPGDCDDTNPEVSPTAAEIFYDGVDQNCASGDELDADGDGHDSLAYGGDDCLDNDPNAHPGAAEVWYDGVDNDCDGGSDQDADGDGFARAYDCDDTDPTVRPGAGGTDMRCEPRDAGRCAHAPASLFAAILAFSLLCRRRAALALLLFAPLSARAHTALSVLLLHDGQGPGASSLQAAIVLEGASADLYPEASFDGTNPGLSAYDVVVHLDGDADSMTAAGQATLDSFVRGGGGYVYAGLGPTALGAGQLSGLRELILLDAAGTSSGAFTLTATTTHPVLRRVPSTFTAQGLTHLATLHAFSSDPATVIATDGGYDAVAVRGLGAGRVVTLHAAVNAEESTWATLSDANVQTLLLDAIYWSFDCDADGDGALSDYCHGSDCDDAAPLNFLGNPEVCDGVDNDCDLDADEDAAIDAPIWYADSDGDGFGDPYTPTPSCAQPSAMVADSSDCDDGEPRRFPGASELCDGADDDCDARIDEDAADALPWFEDYDGDGYGDPASVAWSCAPPAGHVADATDCDDNDPGAHPSAPERCGGGDEDCDATIDESGAADAMLWYPDQDSDGFGDGEVVLGCAAPPGHAAAPGDCDDSDPLRYPEAPERCDLFDTDCDGRADDPESTDAPRWYTDADADGHGAGLGEPACAQPEGRAPGPDDCDDSNPTISPSSTEIANDGVDQDCDGQDLCDADGDGFCADEDCDDADPGTYPGAAETWYDGIDNNCDESSDYDADGDGFESGGYGGDDCDDADPLTHPGALDAPYDGVVRDCDASDESDVDGDGAEVPADCDDFNSAVFPGAEERWYDGLDQDCDGNDADADGDGYPLNTDCDDGDPQAWPGAEGFKADCTPRGCGAAPVAGPWWLLALALLGRRQR